jgi:predicted transposase YdaD
MPPSLADETLHHPHDKLLRSTLAKLDNARSFFQNLLPSDVCSAIAWKSLRLLPPSFIDPQFAASESDLLFSVSLRRSPVLLYVLFEHQSRESPRMALRLLDYVVRVWKRVGNGGSARSKLPPVFPVVLAQGKRPWKAPRRLRELIDLGAQSQAWLTRWQPDLEYCLIELFSLPYEQLLGTAEIRLMLRLLKAEPVGDLLGGWVWDEELLQQISEDALERWARYICHADVQPAAFFERVETLRSQTMKTKTRTLAHRLHEEGRQEGREEGRKEGLLEAARRSVVQALRVKHGRVPAGVVEALAEIDSVRNLEELDSAALLSETLEQFSEKL